MPHLTACYCARLLLIAAALSPNAYASCGAAFCMLNTAWETQGVSTDASTRLDLRYEYIDLDQPRTGHEKISPGAISRHHDEQRTLNRNIVATVDYAPNSRDGISVQLPFLKRDHSHIHNHQGEQLQESWEFDGMGDARIVARRRLTDDGETVAQGALFGIKVASGSTTKTNEDGDRAERSLQPGSGTTDLILGYFANTLLVLNETPTHLFMQTQIQAPTNATGGFRPGNQYSVDLGIAYPVTASWNSLLQLNTLIRDPDRGWEGERTDSGGSFFWLSPGVSYAINHTTQFYSFVQLPLYQRVNGVQLTASGSAAAGIHWRF